MTVLICLCLLLYLKLRSLHLLRLPCLFLSFFPRIIGYSYLLTARSCITAISVTVAITVLFISHEIYGISDILKHFYFFADRTGLDLFGFFLDLFLQRSQLFIPHLTADFKRRFVKSLFAQNTFCLLKL